MTTTVSDRETPVKYAYRLAAAAVVMSTVACVIAGLSWRNVRRHRAEVSENAQMGNRATSRTPPGATADSQWLKGTMDERFGQVERHVRGLDLAMAEIGYRYGELLVAGRERNWDYAKYQAEKMDLSLRLALERRPKRAQSAQSFLKENLPAVLRAVQSKNEQHLDVSLEQLHNSCVTCHRSENVLYFRGALERIRDNAIRPAQPR